VTDGERGRTSGGPLDLRIDSTGTVHPVGRAASQSLRARAGEWRLLRAPSEVVLATPAREGARFLRLAGQVRVPGGLCDIITTIAQGSYTGELFVLEEEASRSIYFEGGNVVGATTNVLAERLGEILWRFGAITRDQHDQILRAAEKSGKRVGDTAMDLEFVEADELFRMMARQVEEVFYAAVHVADATFHLFDGFDEKVLTRRHHLSTGHLLIEAARRMDEMHFFREKVPSDAWVPALVGAASGKKPPPDLSDVLVECDGRRSVAEIGRRTGQLEFEVTRAVFQLATAGFVTVAPPRPEGPAAVVEVVNRALVDVHRTCAARSGGAELREGLEQFVASTGTYVPLFDGAGPQLDGSLKADRIGKNARVLAGADAERWLAAQLFDYAGFALFHAGSLLPRDEETALKERVTEMLKPLRQQLEGNAPSGWKDAPTGPPPAVTKELR
jgi:hypothetical protein